MYQRPRCLIAMLLTVCLLLVSQVAHQAQAQTTIRCFDETGLCIEGRLYEFWQQNGGVAVFGLPITSRSEQMVEGHTITVQWFERARLELHPENPPPYDVLTGRLGVAALEQQERDWRTFPRSEPQPGCRFFAETGQNVCGALLTAWRSNGLELDGQAGTSEVESLALSGLPISPVMTETLDNGQTYQVQWFERTRLELHPENTAPHHVLSGLLGRETLPQYERDAGLQVALATPAEEPTPEPAGSSELQAAFAAAAEEFAVPERILLSVSYNLSRWEQHNGEPSVVGGYGLMHLTETALNDEGRQTLDDAAALLDLDREVLKHDPVQNIRGGTAMLAQYVHDTIGWTDPDPSAWYGAVAKYSGTRYRVAAFAFADAVYQTINEGVSRTTSDGQHITLEAQAMTPNKDTTSLLDLVESSGTDVDCPYTMECEYIPAAYIQNNPGNPYDYGSYALANRPDDGLDIRYVVIHTTEEDYPTTIEIFQNPLRYATTQYVIRSVDGHVVQMVHNKDVAWHSGSSYFNKHSIGIEHIGYSIEGATWYTEPMYRASANLVRYLAAKYHFPLDRAHIIGHDEVPARLPGRQAGMHWDPGPFWDWAHYMELLEAPIDRHDVPEQEAPGAVTINPDFASNTPPMRYCYQHEASDCRDVPVQPANFLYLHTAPDHNAPLITNPYIGADPSYANNWANKARTGQRFYRVERQGDWDAIYFSGKKAWFYNPDFINTSDVVSGTLLVTPRAGAESIPVYGHPYPEPSAYPPGERPLTPEPIYELPAGQVYVVAEQVTGSYASIPPYSPGREVGGYVVVRDQTVYYRIFYNHRFGFVRASDVEVLE